jgi:hypothetical protein
VKTNKWIFFYFIFVYVLGSKMWVQKGGSKWGSRKGVPNGGSKWGSKMGVQNQRRDAGKNRGINH